MLQATHQPTPSAAQEAETLAYNLKHLQEAEALAHDLRKLLVRSEEELIKSDTRENLERLEHWVESYRRGFSAALKISGNGMEILRKARDQLRLTLEEILRLDDEGCIPPEKRQVAQSEHLASAIRRIDRLIPEVEHSFPSRTEKEEKEEA